MEAISDTVSTAIAPTAARTGSVGAGGCGGTNVGRIVTTGGLKVAGSGGGNMVICSKDARRPRRVGHEGLIKSG